MCCSTCTACNRKRSCMRPTLPVWAGRMLPVRAPVSMYMKRFSALCYERSKVGTRNYLGVCSWCAVPPPVIRISLSQAPVLHGEWGHAGRGTHPRGQFLQLPVFIQGHWLMRSFEESQHTNTLSIRTIVKRCTMPRTVDRSAHHETKLKIRLHHGLVLRRWRWRWIPRCSCMDPLTYDSVVEV
jgi:hypothetical protein